MVADVKNSMSIKAVDFDVTLVNLNNFKEYWTETFYIHGNPWKFNCEMIPKNGYQQKCLAVFLCPEIDKKMKDWVVVGSYEVKILSNKFNCKPHVAQIEPHSFVAETTGWGRCCFIEWNDLMDPDRGYVFDDKCRITVNVKASPLQLLNDEKLLAFLPLTQCCDGATRGEFQIKLNDVLSFVDVCSPRFVLKYFSWRIIVFRRIVENKDCLQIQLHSESRFDETELLFKVTLICKLVSSDETIGPITNKFENMELGNDDTGYNLNIISWDELMNPQMKYIQDNSFVLEITIDVKETKEQQLVRSLKRAAKDDKPKAITLECPICFANLADRALTVLICGHMYCTACIAESLGQKRNCPSCNRDIPEGELQKVYLPIE